jgi:hypothetical protein
VNKRGPLDLKRDLMLQAAASTGRAGSHSFWTCTIASDGWSVGLLLRRLGNLYRAYSERRLPRWQSWLCSMQDFAVAAGVVAGEVLEKQLSAIGGSNWRRPALLELPTDRSRPAARVAGMLGQRAFRSLLLAVKALSQREGVSLCDDCWPSNVAEPLFRTRGHHGGVSHRRAQSNGDRGFDWCLSTPSRCVLDLSGNPTFRELLRRVRTKPHSGLTLIGTPF